MVEIDAGTMRDLALDSYPLMRMDSSCATESFFSCAISKDVPLFKIKKKSANFFMVIYFSKKKPGKNRVKYIEIDVIF